jgi:hypothetical protein
MEQGSKFIAAFKSSSSSCSSSSSLFEEEHDDEEEADCLKTKNARWKNPTGVGSKNVQ